MVAPRQDLGSPGSGDGIERVEAVQAATEPASAWVNAMNACIVPRATSAAERGAAPGPEGTWRPAEHPRAGVS